MKTQKEMIELLAESDTIEQTDIMVQLDIYNESGKELKNYLMDRCLRVDGHNVLDYLALAIDQIGHTDGINLIDEILSVLNDGEDTPTEEDRKDQSGRMTGFQPAQQMPRPKKLKLESAPIRNLGKEEFTQEQSLREDAQAAVLYMDIFNYQDTKDPDDRAILTQAKIKLSQLEYPVEDVEFDVEKEPRLRKHPAKCIYGSVWKSPNFIWHQWYKGEYASLVAIPNFDELRTLTLMVGLKWDGDTVEIQEKKYKIPHGYTDYIEMESFTYPIKSIHHLVEQTMEKTKKSDQRKAPTKTAYQAWQLDRDLKFQPFEDKLFASMDVANDEDTERLIGAFPDLFKELRFF